MDIKFIGTGGAFDYEHFNSAALVTRQGANFLIDCGNRCYSRLRELGLADRIDHILITHTHDDHVGSLASLILHQKHVSSRKVRVKLYYPDEDFRKTLEDYLSFAFRPVTDYVELLPLDTLGFVDAINTKGLHVPWMQTWGYLFYENDQTLAYSGDLGDEAIVFDTLRAKGKTGATVFHEITFSKEISNHAYYKRLEPQLADFTIYGYHCHPAEKPADCKIPLVAEVPEWLLS